MDVALKGFLQGSIPVVVFVGGAHHFTKKLKTSKPVLYYGSLLAGLGLAYAVVEGKIKAPFMNAEGGGEMTCNDKLNEAYDWIGFHNGEENLREFMDSIGIKDEEFGAETFEDLYYCSKCDEGFSSINPTDEGQFCDSCLPSSATLHDEMERITMDAETFENCEVCYATVDKGTLNDVQAGRICDECHQMNKYAGGTGRQNNPPFSAETFENNHTIEVSKGDLYAVRPKIRKWIRAMQEKGFSYIIRKDQTPGLEAYVDSPSEFLVYEIGNIDDITNWIETDSKEFGEYNDEMKLYISTKNNEIYTSRYGETNRHASRSVIYFPAKGIGLAYGAETFEAPRKRECRYCKEPTSMTLWKGGYGYDADFTCDECGEPQNAILNSAYEIVGYNAETFEAESDIPKKVIDDSWKKVRQNAPVNSSHWWDISGKDGGLNKKRFKEGFTDGWNKAREKVNGKMRWELVKEKRDWDLADYNVSHYGDGYNYAEGMKIGFNESWKALDDEPIAPNEFINYYINRKSGSYSWSDDVTFEEVWAKGPVKVVVQKMSGKSEMSDSFKKVYVVNENYTNLYVAEIPEGYSLKERINDAIKIAKGDD